MFVVLAGALGCAEETSDMGDAMNAVSDAAVAVMVAHGRCTSKDDCATTRELLVTTPGRGETTIDVFDVNDPALAFEIATRCGRLVGSGPNLGRVVVRVHRLAPRRPARRKDGSRSGLGVPGWGFTFQTI